MNRQSLLIVIFLVWLSQAGSSSLINNEYADIVSSLSKSPAIGECKVSVDITRSWPLSWTPRSAIISVKNQNMALTAFTSKFNVPDRVFLKSHNTKYHFTWSRKIDEKHVASFVDVEVKPNGNVHAVNIGNCSNYRTNKELIGNLEHCNLPVQLIKCS